MQRKPTDNLIIGLAGAVHVFPKLAPLQHVPTEDAFRKVKHLHSAKASFSALTDEQS